MTSSERSGRDDRRHAGGAAGVPRWVLVAVPAALVVLGMLAVVLLLGGDDDGGRPRDSGNGDVTPTVVEEPVAGGVLRLGIERPASLDPARARPVPVSEQMVAGMLFDGLTRFDTETGEVVAALAASWETEDHVTWRFRLREGAVFSDGSPVTAGDAAFSLQRVAGDGELAVAALEVLDEARAERADDGARVVVIELTEPLSDLPAALASPALGVVPRTAVDADPAGFASAPVGSGPFRIDEIAGDVLRLVPAEGRTAWLDAIELHLFDDIAASYAAFVAGEVDWSQVPAELAAEAGARYGTDGFVPYQAVLFYGLNLEHEGFASRRFREAIARSIDRDDVNVQAYDGTLLPSDGPVAAGVPGHQERACMGRCAHDPDAARELLADAFPDGDVPEVEIAFDEGGRQDQVAAILERSLEAVGIPVRLRPMSFEAYKEFVASREQQMFRLGWTASYPSPDAYLAPLFRTDSPDNVLGFAKGAFEERLTAARRAGDEAERRDEYRAAEREVMAELPLVPLGQFQVLGVMSGRVRDLAIGVIGTFDPRAVWLTPSQ